MHRTLVPLALLISSAVFAQPATEMVPMRDGVRLATDIFLPSGKGPWPVILVRTPYSKSKKLAPDAFPDAWVKNGYAYVEQDWRGLFASEGKYTVDVFPGPVNQTDGYDTVEWVARQPWSNGKVGMLGGSGPGNAAKSAILANPPHLVAVFTNFACLFCSDYEPYHGGVTVTQSDDWFAGRGLELPQWPRPRTLYFNFERFTWPPDRQKEAASGNRIALLDNGGWFDIFNPSAMDDFNARRSPNSRVVVGARGHAPMTGSLHYPPQNLPGDSPQAWFDYWLKGIDNGVMTSPPIRYFLMGDTMHKGGPGNLWKQTDRWPVPNTPASYFLANDGALRTTQPQSKSSHLTYAFDPANPVPTVGGNNMGENKGPMDQRKLAERKDILRFQTEPLAQPVAITGKVLVELYVTADVDDTTVMAKLIDVYPDGYQALMLDNALMARFRDGFQKPAPLEKGKVARLTLNLWNTAQVFDKGHRIAVHIAGSNSPRYWIHPNSFQPVPSYANAPTAHVSVEMSAQHPSRLILPIIR